MKISNLQFRAWTSRLYSSVVSLDEGWLSGLEPGDLYSYRIRIEIDAVVLNESRVVERCKIGFIEGIYFDVTEASANVYPIYDIFDSVFPDAEVLYDVLVDDEGDYTENVFYLKGVYIDPDYRRQGIAKKVIENLEHLLYDMLGLKVGYIVTIPLAIKDGGDVQIDSAYEMQLNSVMKGYMERLGYKMVEGTDFMYLPPMTIVVDSDGSFLRVEEVRKAAGE